MYRVYNMNEKNKYTNDIIETIDTIDINDIQNLSSIIIFPEKKICYRGSKRDNYKSKYKTNLESSSPKSISSEFEVEEKSINSRTPSSTRSNSIDDKRVLDDIRSDKNIDISKRIRYTNSNSNSPKSISRNSPKIEDRQILTDMRVISRENSENEEKQLLRILKNHNTTTKKSINLRK